VNSQLEISEKDLKDILRHIQNKLMLIKQPKHDIYEFFHARFGDYICDKYKHEFPEKWDINRLVDVVITLSKEEQYSAKLNPDLKKYLEEIIKEPVEYQQVINQVIDNIIDNNHKGAAIGGLMLFISSLRREGCEDLVYDKENEILQIIRSEPMSERHKLIAGIIEVYLEDKNTLSENTLIALPQEIDTAAPSFYKARSLCIFSRQIESINNDLATETLEKAEKMLLNENCDWKERWGGDWYYRVDFYCDISDEAGLIKTLERHNKIEALTQICAKILQKSYLHYTLAEMNWAIDYLLSHGEHEIAAISLLQNEKKRSGLKIKAMLKMKAAECFVGIDTKRKIKLLREANELLQRHLIAARTENSKAETYKLILKNLFEIEEFDRASVIYNEVIKQISTPWILRDIQDFFKKQKEKYSNCGSNKRKI